MPAMLKGWFERVMVPGVGFVFDASSHVQTGLAARPLRMVGTTPTAVRRRAYVKGCHDNGRRMLLRALRMYDRRRTRSILARTPLRMDSPRPNSGLVFLDGSSRRMVRL